MLHRNAAPPSLCPWTITSWAVGRQRSISDSDADEGADGDREGDGDYGDGDDPAGGSAQGPLAAALGWGAPPRNGGDSSECTDVNGILPTEVRKRLMRAAVKRNEMGLD